MGRTVDKDLRRPDHSFLWTRGRALLGAYRLPDSGLVLDCNRSSGSICAGFYFILVWILSIIRIRAEVSWLFLDFIYLPKKHFTKLKILFFEKFCLLNENLKPKSSYQKFRACLMGSLCTLN